MPDPKNYIGYGEEEKDPYSIKKWAPTVIRGAGGFIPPFIGPAPTGLLNAPIEVGAQLLEGRPEINWTQVGTQGALGMVPFGKTASLARTAGKGALLGAGATLATQQAEEGLHTPTEEDIKGLGIGAALGGAGGGIAYGIGKKLGKGATKGIGKADIETPPAGPGITKKTGTSFEPGELPKPLIKSGEISLEPQRFNVTAQPSPTMTWSQPGIIGEGVPTVTTPTVTKAVTTETPVVETPGTPGKVKPSTKAPASVRFNPQTGKIELEGAPPTAKLTGTKKKPAKVTSTIVGEEVHPVTGKKITTQVVEEAGVTKKNEKFQEPQKKAVEGELLPPEEELDMFGIPKNRDLTPEEVATIKKSILAREGQYYGEGDTAAFQKLVDDIEGVIPAQSREQQTIFDEIKHATDQGFVVYPKTYKGPKEGIKIVGKLSDGSIVGTWKGNTQAYVPFRRRLEPPQEPQFSKKKVDPVTGRPIKAAVESATEITGLGTDVDRDAAISMLTNLYEGDMATIATKELVQNSLDNVRPQGKNGLVQVDLDENTTSVSVTDNGTGMTPNQLKSVYMIIGKTGKKAGSMDIGGYGVAKAAFQLGGKNFSIETIAKDTDGKIKKTTFSATPEDFKQKRITAKIEEMPAGTPTGTKVTVQLNPGNYNTKAAEFMKNVGKYSGTEGRIQTRVADFGDKIETMPYVDVPNSLKTSGKVLGVRNTSEADYTFIMPQNVRQGRFEDIEIALLNKGMYQGLYSVKSEGGVVPEKIIIDVSSKVDALDKNYPFVPSRERLKWSGQHAVSTGVKEFVLDAANKIRQMELQKLYDNVPAADFANVSSKTFTFLDPRGVIDEEEFKVLEHSQVLNYISAEWSSLVKEMIDKMSGRYPHWGEHIEKIGFMMTEPGYYGVHIPNPTTKKGAVYINPFNHFVGAFGDVEIPPLEAAYNMHHTMVHEVAHSPVAVGKSLTPHESAKFEEMIGEAYAKLNIIADAQRANIVRAISDDNGQTYSRGVQELLSWYKTAIRRGSTQEDLLSGTGIKSASSKQTVEGPLARDIRPTGGGTPPGSKPPKPPSGPPSVTIPGEGGSTTPPVKTPWEEFKELSTWGKIKHLMGEQRQAQTTMDMSFPFRQGIAAVTRPEFWNNIGPMMRSFSNEGEFLKLIKEIESRPRFNQMHNAGVEFTHLSKELSKTKGREEQLQGTLLEQFIPPVRWSNRAYTAIANKMRADLFDSLAKDMERAGIDLGDGKNANAKALAAMVNDMTGRGKLPFNLERVANEVNHVFFSPKLIASRLNMFRRAFQDPRMLQGVDDKAAKVLRKEAIRSMLGIGGMAATGAGISATMFDEPDAASPLSADFGKFKVGDTRIDMTGGFQQYVRAAAQLATGMAKVDGEMRDRNRAMTGERFVRAKLAPLASTVVDWMAGKDVIGEEFEWSKEAKDLITPLIINDLMEIQKEDPGMTAVTTPLSFFGAGVQSYGKRKVEPGEKVKRRSSKSKRTGTPKMFRIPQVKLYQPGT